MKTVITFTSTLSARLFDWVSDYAKERKVTKRKILEEALQRCRREVKREAMAAGFRRAAKDPEIFAMAEWGMEDYFEQLKKFD